MKQVGIIIQARMGSTRLPGKMAKKFYDEKSLLEVILDRVKTFTASVPVVVATSSAKKDDYIEKTATDNNILVFRGSEEDVLSRFVGAADTFGIEKIIRICADNPFIQTKYIKQLIDYNSDSDADYVGFRINRKQPAITTHLGFFPEMVSSKALKQINVPELDSIYREHVTNFFYRNNHSNFNTDWIDLSFPIDVIENIRLTIDVERDFEIADEIYRYLKENELKSSDNEIIEYLSTRENLINKMKLSIQDNEK